ncbi:MAG: hypothetical protein MUC95_02890 [Spirochaetes bacterium]|nr:hypothetical protein [Spirochaetota bacterium]
MRNISSLLPVVCLIACIFTIALNPAPVMKTADLAEKDMLAGEGDSLMKMHTLAGYKEAYVKYKKALALAPDNVDLMIKTAGVLNCIMRVKTNSNTINVDGSTQDNDTNKAIWKKYGEEAVKYASTAAEKRPNDVNAAVVYMEAYMYYMSSFGIFQAIFEGAAGKYKSLASTLITKFPAAEDAMGYVYMGVFYLIAPWPMSDSEEAGKYFRKAVELSPTSVANHYYVAVQAIKDEDYKLAEKELNFVLENPCNNGQEYDYCGYLKSEAKRGLSIIQMKR